MQLRQRLAAAALALGMTGGGAALLTSAEFIGKHEGEVRTVYTDIGGVSTWCFGQTVGKPKAQYTAEECAQDLLKTTATYHKGIMQFVPQEAPQSVQAALTSVAYNVGVAGTRHPVFTGPLARHDWQATCAAIVAPWPGKHGVALGFKATVRGKPVRGLERRRWQEYQLCLEDLR